MNRLAIIAGFGFIASSIAACATNKSTLPSDFDVLLRSPHAEATPRPLKGDDLLAQRSPEVREAVKQYRHGGIWPTFTTDHSQLYPYDQGPEPVLSCEPLRTTDIQLQTGETITDVAMGDTERWQAIPAASGDPKNPVPHLAVKPQAPGIKTNLTIYTTRHIYHLNLRSRPGHGIEEVEFYYPDELRTSMKEADQQASQSRPTAAADDDGVANLESVDPSTLNFSYKVSGPAVPWRPVRAFDDGTHVYIEMPTSMKSADAPALLVSAGGGNEMVNYRVRSNYYVVDRLFDDAEMVAGVGRAQDRVTVAYTGGAR
jgi:type IV secretion system protein TrbG